ncbi:hypothetical protein [Nostoc sp. DedSLP04]|uniref:hypothetical protein n=1 Tax=Nostoc sp. DedSLP04 TaxID=3075401 RepID=UPI002AD2C67C|nr:hypothetical protein [Nostoc sp. DedSLP04]MDZ8030588.1 hypothetical protein [Nostoc sp. DedSLP04]
MSTTPAAILDVALQKVSSSIAQPIVTNPSIAEKIDYVSRYVGNRAVVRLLLACSLAAVHRGNIDIRKPYTEIGTQMLTLGATTMKVTSQHSLTNTSCLVIPLPRSSPLHYVTATSP